MRRIARVTVACSLTLAGALHALPATADTDSGLFTGDAAVGKNFVDVNNGEKGLHLCNQENAHRVRAHGTGLFFPDAANKAAGIAKSGTWSIKTSVIGLNPLRVNQWDVCGHLGAVVVGGVSQGAACGMSTGHSGVGKIRLGLAEGDKAAKKAHIGQIILLRNVGWILTAGGTLPVTGDASWATASKVKKGKTAKLVAKLITMGGGACADPKSQAAKGGGGAQSFAIVGTYDLVQS